MNRCAELHSTADLALRRFDHPPETPHEDPDLEVAERWAIAYVRTGTFAVIINDERHDLRHGSVFLTSPGLRFRCAHEADVPCDVCDSVAFADAAVAGHEYAWSRIGWTVRSSPPPRLAYVQRRLAEATQAANAFEIERWALASLTALGDESRATHRRGPYAFNRRDLDAVLAACESIDRDPESIRSVADRAHAVGRSSAQLTHAFRRYVGISPHQYVVRRRLAWAAERLADRQTVSDCCYRAGFENLGHFSRSFRRLLGCPPSEWARLPRTEQRRKVHALLTRAR